MEQIADRLQTHDRNAFWQVNKKEPRPLTYDEKKAAEAAFQGAPFNPAWSEAAWQVYEGIFDAMVKMGARWITPLEENLSE